MGRRPAIEIEAMPMSDQPAALVLRRGALSVQICVPKTWTDEEVKTFADTQNPSGTETGWHVRKEEHYPARGQGHERVACSGDPRCVHVVLDA